MTDRLALILGIVVVCAGVADLTLNGGEAMFFLARKVVTFIDYLVFWNW
jgi:hypothetical protein